MKNKVIIFGCGKGGERAFNYLNKKNEILFFCDNNINLHGKKFINKDIVSPSELKKYKFDCIYLASMYHEEIKKQLQKLGIDEDKIRFIGKKILYDQKVNWKFEILFGILTIVAVYFLSNFYCSIVGAIFEKC